MLDYSLAHWIGFFTAAVLLNISPGPDMAFILGHTMKSGTRAGFSAVFGIWTGCLHPCASRRLRPVGDPCCLGNRLLHRQMGGRDLSRLARHPGAALERRGRLQAGGRRNARLAGHLPTGRAGLAAQSEGSDLLPRLPAAIRRRGRRSCMAAACRSRRPDHCGGAFSSSRR